MRMLSVCITTYNTRKDIAEAVRSVVAQKTSYAYEILIGDDGSTDSTVEAVIALQKEYPGLIRLYQMEREPQKKYNFIERASLNRLNLFQHARGEYICFLDGDDFYSDEHFFQTALSLLEQDSSLTAVGGQTEIYFPKQGIKETILLSEWEVGAITKERYWERHYTHAAAIIFRSNFDLKYSQYSEFDDNTLTLLGIAEGRIYLLDHPVLTYRQGESSYITRPVAERVLWEAMIYETSLGIDPKLEKASQKRLKNQVGAALRDRDKFLLRDFPEVYHYAKLHKINSITSLIEGNLTASKIKSVEFFKDLIKRRIPRDFEREYQRAKAAAKKAAGEPIHVAFLVYRPALWISMASVYKALRADSAFKVTIITTPMYDYYSDDYHTEGAAEFFRDFACEVVEGQVNGEFIDLATLNIDYLFYLQPYNIMLPEKFRSNFTRSYTKLCYIVYGNDILDDEIALSCLPPNFTNDCTFVFISHESQRKIIEKWLYRGAMLEKGRIYNLGYSRYDDLRVYENSQEHSWQLPKGRLRVLYTPRWCTEEGNSTFFDYKDKILEYAQANAETVEVMLRPHPQMWKNLAYNSKEMTESEQAAYRAKFDAITNASIDSRRDYFATIFAASVFITDASSMMSDYLVTGKPIIYTHKTKDNLSKNGRLALEGCYYAKTWDDVEGYLKMLAKGEDPLKERRKEVRKAVCNEATGGGAGAKIAELIKEDFFKQE